jgi:hypothetical protein
MADNSIDPATLAGLHPSEAEHTELFTAVGGQPWTEQQPSTAITADIGFINKPII